MKTEPPPPKDHRSLESLIGALPADPPQRRRGPLPLARWLIVAAVFAGLGIWVWRLASHVPEVRIAPVAMADLWTSFTAEGVVRGREYAVSAEVGGRVVELPVREGESVARGAVLARLNAEQPVSAVVEAEAAYQTARRGIEQARAERSLLSRRFSANVAAARARLRQAELQHRHLLAGARSEEIEQARQRVAKAAAALDEADQNLQRARRLFTAGAIARANLERAEAAEKLARSDLREAEAGESLLRAGPRAEQIAVSQSTVDAARSDLRQAESAAGEIAVADRALEGAESRASQAQAAVRRAESAVRQQTILAPADGIVTRLNVELGSIAVPGSAAIVLSTREDLRIEAEISTEDTSKLRPGMDVSVSAGAFPGRSFRAKVRSLMPVGELKPGAAIRTRIVRAQVEILQSPQSFRPGMEVDVEGRMRLGASVTVRTDALRFTGDRPSVLMIENGRVVERFVKIGTQNAEVTEILSGLRVGEEVVVAGKDELQPGQRARAVRQ